MPLLGGNGGDEQLLLGAHAAADQDQLRVEDVHHAGKALRDLVRPCVQQKLLIDPIAAKVKAAVMPAFAEGLEIRAAQLHNDAGMVGAVYYFRQTMEKE